jgi:hypothetical protein
MRSRTVPGWLCLAAKNVLSSCLVTSIVSLGASAQATIYSYPLVNSGGFAIGDIDGDGLRDFVIVRPGLIADVHSGGSGQLLGQIVYAAPYESIWLFFEGKDHDGDGRADFMYLTQSGGYQLLHVQLRSSVTGAILYTSPPISMNYDPYQRCCAISDINGDGRCEIVVGEPGVNLGAGQVHVIDPVTGAILRTHAGTYNNEGLMHTIDIGDADADGYDDYVVRSAQGGVWGYSGLTGQQLFVIGGPTSYGRWMKKVGDWNGDGYEDFAIWNNGSYPFGTYEQTQVMAGPNAGLLWSRAHVYGQPVPPDYGPPLSARIGDLDGDGFADAALGRRVISGRSQSLIRDTPAGILGSPGDANGDGFPDLYVNIQNSGTWFWALQSGAPPGTSSLGTPCTDSSGKQPICGITIGARLGRTMSVNLSNAHPNLVLAVLALGNSSQQWGGTPLPFDLGLIGIPGCQWRIAGDVLLTLPTGGLPGGRRRSSHPIAVPNNTQLLGLDVFAQWLLLEQGPGGLTGSATRAVRTTVVP